MYGYAGRVLYVDLNTGKTRVKPLNEDYAKKYISGIGLGMRLLHYAPSLTVTRSLVAPS